MAGKRIYSETVVAAFLKYDKLSDIAREIGVTPQTVAKYRDDPTLQEILSERKLQFVKAAVSKMQGFMTEGVEILQNIIRDSGTSPQTRVNAIQIMFNQCKAWTETTDILERLQALENAENNEK
ncbi:MAG: hypothetical protein Q4E73_09880 [Lachnospiraceae bacterium]|nr:hypothetical protein [Lachnospiraceae bacterium]